MAPDQILPLRASFDKLWPVNQRFAETFYARLFELKPKARSLFSADLAAQKAKVTGMLATIVGAVDKPEMFGSWTISESGTHSSALPRSITQPSARL
jgi:hypothetical protein